MSALFGLIAWLKLCCDAAHQVTTDNLTLTDEQLKEKYPLGCMTMTFEAAFRDVVNYAAWSESHTQMVFSAEMYWSDPYYADDDEDIPTHGSFMFVFPKDRKNNDTLIVPYIIP
jgi:hypothetical protein